MAVPPWRDLLSIYFDYQQTLRGDELRMYVERAEAPSREIRRRLAEQPSRPLKFFFAGTPGSGKSTELAELGRLLDEDFAVVGLDVYASAANVATVTSGEILFMMGAAACRLAAERWDEVISPGAKAALFDAFRGIAHEPSKLDLDRLIRGTALLGGAAAEAAGLPGASAVASAVASVATSVTPASITLQPFGGTARELRESDPVIDRLAEALAGVLAEVAAVRPPVILIDGLDRIEDADTIRQLFVQTRVLDLPPYPVVYNGPIALWSRPRGWPLPTRRSSTSAPCPTYRSSRRSRAPRLSRPKPSKRAAG